MRHKISRQADCNRRHVRQIDVIKLFAKQFVVCFCSLFLLLVVLLFLVHVLLYLRHASFQFS